MFERRHYQAIAETLRRLPLTNNELDRVVEHFATTFKADNARFDQHRFRAACFMAK